MSEYRVSMRYARAVMELAKQKGIADIVLKDFSMISSTIEQSKELKVFICNPVILPEKKKKVFTELFKNSINQMTFELLMLIANKGREVLISSIADQYENLYNSEYNRLKVEIVTANQIDDNAELNMTSRLAKQFGKEIIPTFKVKKDIIGGVKIKIGDKVIDGSVKNQLCKIRNTMKLGEK